MPVITLPSGQQYSAEPDESLLAAALRQEVVLPYSCRSGRCSSCKGRVAAGTTVALHDELGLGAAERDSGWILTCVRAATTDVTLQIEDLTGLHLPPARLSACRIDALALLAPDVMRVLLRLPPTSPFLYLPGQYIDIVGPQGQRRSYSIANAAAVDKRLELHIKRVPGGALSEYWFNTAKANDLLRLNGPLGTFFLRDLAGLDLVFLATGTGMAPVKAMLEGLDRLEAGQAPDSVTVFWGGRTPEDLYLDADAPLFQGRLVPVLSRADDAWAGPRGHVQHALLARRPDLARTAVYACGSDAMIHTSKELLASMGLPESRFFSDAFVCSQTSDT